MTTVEKIDDIAKLVRELLAERDRMAAENARAYADSLRLRGEIAALRDVGSTMASVCFNYSQRGPDADREMFSMLYKRWDAIKRTEKLQ